MKIIRHGNLYEQGPIKCPKCECEFTYCQNDIKKEQYSYEDYDGWQHDEILAVRCPECREIIEV